MKPQGVEIGLTAVILAVTDEAPRVLVVRRDALDALPAGPFDPRQHRTLELGLWQWVETQTGLDLRYVEQLHSFGNRYRDPREPTCAGPKAAAPTTAVTIRSARATGPIGKC